MQWIGMKEGIRRLLRDVLQASQELDRENLLEAEPETVEFEPVPAEALAESERLRAGHPMLRVYPQAG